MLGCKCVFLFSILLLLLLLLSAFLSLSWLLATNQAEPSWGKNYHRSMREHFPSVGSVQRSSNRCRFGGKITKERKRGQIKQIRQNKQNNTNKTKQKRIRR
jgi:hypothetical protein